MSSLISPSDKETLSSVFDSIHDTFAREFRAFKEPEVTRVFTNPASYNALYGASQNVTEVSYEEVSSTFMGRVLYDDRQDYKKFVDDGRNAGEAAQPRVSFPLGIVRLRVNAAGKEFLNGVKRIELDGVNFEVEKLARPHGLFTPNYYDFYLRVIP